MLFLPAGRREPIDAAALADQDGDGKFTWEEYIEGTDPIDAQNVFALAITRTNGNQLVSFPTLCRIHFCAGCWRSGPVFPESTAAPCGIKMAALSQRFEMTQELVAGPVSGIRNGEEPGAVKTSVTLVGQDIGNTL